MNVVIVIVLLSAFAFWELPLLFIIIFGSRETARRWKFFFEDKAINLIFSMFRQYRGFSITLENRLPGPLPKRFLVISNHQSLLDIPIIMHVLPRGSYARFVAKRELGFGVPLISLLLRTSGHCLIRRRGDALQAMRTVTSMANRCKREGTIPVIFPEGTRSRTGELGTFHSAGTRKILEVEPLPILVVAMDGGWDVSKLTDFMRSFGKKPYRVRFIEVLPAPEGRKAALETLEKSRELIDGSLAAMRGETTPDMAARG
ncbi:1-acyl-sn-glycerol-3-phosphate acyltransferase [bacterium]|nr:1-acyl-sn-glycerol-3-phosphate acyltransferase [bacterium]